MKKLDTLSVAMLALAGLALRPLSAQTHIVKKPETVVRAVGVYEWTGEETKPTASRFVPITLFIDGRLEDAGVYLARPVPFALQTGTIFELEHAGVPQGILELAFARHLEVTGDAPLEDAWLGFGAYKPLSQPKEVASTLRPGRITQVEVSGGGKGRPSFNNQPTSGKPAATPSTSTTTDNSTDPDRPSLNRKTGNPSVPQTPAPDAASDSDSSADTERPTMKRRTDTGSGTDSTASPENPSPPNDRSADSKIPATTTDPDHPTMRRPNDSSSANTTSKTDSDDRASEADPDRPTLRKRTEAQRQAARKEHDSSSVIGGTASLNDDPDRPSLHRGKAPGALDADDLPALKGLPAGIRRAVGVSDAARRPEHDFSRAWEEDAERATVLDKLRGAATMLLAAYGSAKPAGSAVKPPVARPLPRTSSIGQKKASATSSKPAAMKTAAPFSEEQLHGYTLSYGGAATYVYSAATADAAGTSRYVSLVAQREPAGELKVAMSNVTDSAHLDRAPRFELIDAVDVEASNRASLLFQLRAQNSRQFALYRVIGAQAQQIFLTGSTQ